MSNVLCLCVLGVTLVLGCRQRGIKTCPGDSSGVTNTAIRRNKMICRCLILFIVFFSSFNQKPVPLIEY